MGWAKQAMAEAPGDGKGEAGAVLAALKEHLPVMGKVAMALAGDGGRVESILEEAAREAGRTASPPAALKAWLLGLVRSAAAKQLSKLPLKTRGFENAPATSRMGEAADARKALQSLRPTEREAVVLSVVGRLGAEDLATACNVDVQTAKTRLARGLELLMDSPEHGKNK